MNTIKFALVALVALLAGAADATATVEALATRPGVVQPVYLTQESKPVASVVLLPGGRGKVGLDSIKGITRGKINFLVRGRRIFAANGFNVAIPDVPSDRQDSNGLNGFRLTDDHAVDIKAVIARMRAIAPVPVLVVGRSDGTLSAASIAALLGPDGPDGVVLTASITERSEMRPATLADVDLSKVRVPTLIVHHREDGCGTTPFAGTRSLKARLTQAPEATIMPIAGGAIEGGSPCRNLSHHSFMGQEIDVIDAISTWIKTRNF
jgi:pimeloyl-ACP methyl ester carboxylesterase